MIVRRHLHTLLALAAVAVLPASALAQFPPDQTRSCSLPMEPDEAFKILRVLSNKGTTSRLKQNGVQSGTRLRVNEFKGDPMAWTVSAQVEQLFAFSGPAAAFGAERLQFGGFSLGLAYDGAAQVLAATVSGQPATLFNFDVRLKPVKVKDSSAVTKTREARIYSGDVTRGMLGSRFADAGDRNAVARPTILYVENRKRGSRRVELQARLPADLRFVLHCDAKAGAVNVGHRLVLSGSLDLQETSAGVDSSGEPVFDRVLRLNDVVVATERVRRSSEEELVPSFSIRGGGAGLYSGVVLQPAFVADEVQFLHDSSLNLRAFGLGQLLIDPVDANFTRFEFCKPGGSC